MLSLKINNPQADFWLIRKGSTEKVGTPVETFSPEHIGVTVDRKVLVPRYAFYWFMHKHMMGIFQSIAHGTTNLKHITIDGIIEVINAR
jgi:hypothetical protein